MARINIGDVVDLAGTIKDVLDKEADKKSTSLEPHDVQSLANQVTTAVKTEVNPVLVNATNQEPWYQSRILIGLFVTIALQIAAAAGVNTDTIDPTSITTILIQIGALAGAAFAVYGRKKTGLKPLGE